MKIIKLCNEKKKKQEQEDDGEWFEIVLVVEAGSDEPEKHFGGKVKLTRIWDEDKRK